MLSKIQATFGVELGADPYNKQNVIDSAVYLGVRPIVSKFAGTFGGKLSGFSMIAKCSEVYPGSPFWVGGRDYLCASYNKSCSLAHIEPLIPKHPGTIRDEILYAPSQ